MFSNYDKICAVERVDYARVSEGRNGEPRHVPECLVVTERRTECLARLCQESLGFMGTSSIRHIPQHNGVDLLPFKLEVRDGRLGREFLAVLSQPEDLSPLSHSPGVYGRIPERADMRGVGGAVPVGDERLELLAHDLARRVSEDRLRAFIEEDDPLGIVDADDRIGRNRDDSGEDGIRYRFSRGTFNRGHERNLEPSGKP